MTQKNLHTIWIRDRDQIKSPDTLIKGDTQFGSRSPLVDYHPSNSISFATYGPMTRIPMTTDPTAEMSTAPAATSLALLT